MKVERESFLVLVAALTAACRDVGPPPEAPEPPVRWSPASTAPSDRSVPARPRPAAQAKTSHAAPLEGNAAEDAVPGPDPFAKTIAGEHCNPMLNLHGFPRTCAALTPPGPTCEGFAWTRDACTSLGTHLKPRVAAKAIDCVLAKNKTEDLCTSNVNGACTYEALASACIEPAAAPVCATLVADCAKYRNETIAQAPCEAAWSALRDDDRPKFIACMSEACSYAACLP